MSERSTDTRVQLGCGTLIIIAIIVALFSGGRRESRELQRQFEALNRRLDRIEQKVDDLSRQLAPAAVERDMPPRPGVP